MLHTYVCWDGIWTDLDPKWFCVTQWKITFVIGNNLSLNMSLFVVVPVRGVGAFGAAEGVVVSCRNGKREVTDSPFVLFVLCATLHSWNAKVLPREEGLRHMSSSRTIFYVSCSTTSDMPVELETLLADEHLVCGNKDRVGG